MSKPLKEQRSESTSPVEKPHVNAIFDGKGGDSSEEEEVDEQDMMDNRDESNDKETGNTDLLVQIKSKHM